jgi:hypothetical protein
MTASPVSPMSSSIPNVIVYQYHDLGQGRVADRKEVRVREGLLDTLVEE